ncbi:2-amino-4-hydroxy-6-hydroxymethyldihydropteridine diphosphokinase [Mucilaginibacter sp. UR6-11]|uniref:2-amino-4-hydroxy-6- hydroxymethyldihydropteridine diphosphokinase n=1 Tax=Mucilaginibacter sp. UR6-11 TaxID=1435644 RepID=UPI001E5FAA38|nr:2-amino-4-hydroxy-6-hydroxymethyldihydropteridine diphosphokinase [Mucilaginibacter sp. UR6-11]MCC8426676.1 2-amino-4-hydroxy-6-hydroxymethyldihydropteridine diphosphokinase [Mucilaginibacter sp. UR6-11]
MNEVFLLLGSNLGDRKFFLQQAIMHIAYDIAPATKISSVYETQSWGKTDEPDYLNMVVALETDLPAKTILEKILFIEEVMGRKREEKWGSRIIDIDILYYNQEVIDKPELQIPHPEMHKRRFTLEPLAEIAPDFMHPVLHKNNLALKSELKDNLIVKKL